MALAFCTTWPHEIESLLGAVVWAKCLLATRLQRTVAIKVLPARLSLNLISMPVCAEAKVISNTPTSASHDVGSQTRTTW
jgi:hypothetical protein